MSDGARNVIAAAAEVAHKQARDWGEVADLTLAALRSEGWEVYRPDECETTITNGDRTLPDGTYRLVPVPAESEERNG